MRSIIDALDLSVEEIDELCAKALDIMADPRRYSRACEGKKLAALFYEPSTRTRMSFEAAMIELGGHVLSQTDESSSSVSKGESVADTVKVISFYADIIAMRHPREGAAQVAANRATVPVINSGDGGHCHPTQTLADLLTIYREKGSFSGLTVGVCGDLLYGRTVHSLIGALARYENVRFVLISPRELRLPDYIKNGIEYEESESLDGVLSKLDILYMTRIQRERFANKEDYDRLKDSCILTAEKMKKAKPDCCVMHPLPRVNEIAVSIDDDPRACYFKQAENGKYMRMALILKLLEEAEKDPSHIKKKGFSGDYVCVNPRCITATEQELEQEFKKYPDGTVRCIYCEAKARKK